MHTAQELVASVEGLWSIPDVYYRVREAINDPDTSVDQLSGLIASDPSMTGSLLRLANSAFFGFPRRIDTLSRAISLIGLDQVSEVVLASALAASFNAIAPDGIDTRGFWRDSVRRALLCRVFSQHLRLRDGERLFVAGLLSDTGHLVMAHAMPNELRTVLRHPHSSLATLAEREREELGCDFAEVAAALTSAWRLPVTLGTLVGAQMMPPWAGDLGPEAALLNIAAEISHAIEGRQPEPTGPAGLARMHPDALDLANLPAAALPELAVQAQNMLGEVIQSLGLVATA